MKLITVQRAKEEVKRLQEYINLVESYQADTLEKWIIKEYAYTNSLKEVVKRANDRGFSKNGSLIDRPYATSIVNGKATDALHRFLRSGYRQKIKSDVIGYDDISELKEGYYLTMSRKEEKKHRMPD